MVYRLASVWFLFSQALLAAELPRGVVARVNGTLIQEEDIAKFEDYRTAPRADLIERAVLFQLAVEQAKKRGIEKEVKIQKEVDKVLYQGFLNSVLREKGQNLIPTSDEVKAFYQENPLFRVSHLVLLSDTPEKKKSAMAIVKKIQKGLEQKVPFKTLVLKYSEDEGARFGGDLDFRGVHDLSPDFYKVLKALKIGAVSEPLVLDGSIHFIQWTNQKPFMEVPESYLSYIKARLRREKELLALSYSLSDLRKEAKVEVLETTALP